jgi:spore maturation protein CgeB
VSTGFVVKFRDPADLVWQLRDAADERMEQAKMDAARARTVREKYYYDGRVDAFGVMRNFMAGVHLVEVE